MIFLISSWQTA